MYPKLVSWVCDTIHHNTTHDTLQYSSIDVSYVYPNLVSWVCDTIHRNTTHDTLQYSSIDVSYVYPMYPMTYPTFVSYHST